MNNNGFYRGNYYRPFYPRYSQGYRRLPYAASPYTKKPYQGGRKTYKKYKRCYQNEQRGIVSVVRGPTPTQTFAKLRLSGIVAITLDAASYNDWDQGLSILNIENPSAFLAGQQPIGFDQWSTMFQRYTVHGCKVKFDISRDTKASDSSDTRQISFTALPSTMSISQIRTAADAGGTTGQGVTCALQCDRFARNVALGRVNGNGQIVSLKHYIATKTLFPTQDVKDDPDFTGTTASFSSGASAPVNQAYWYFGIQANEADVGGADTVITIRIYATYYTQFSSPVNLYDT